MPRSIIRPSASSRTRSAWRIVLRRWATTKLVRPASRRSSATCTFASVIVSTALVASSKIKIRGSASIARQKHTICRWPSDRLPPFSPTSVCKPLRQELQHVQAVERAGRFDDLFIRRFGSADTDVVHHTAGEEVVALQHDAELLSEGMAGDLLGVVPVDQDPAQVGQVKLRDQVDDRRLAAAGLADERNRLARALLSARCRGAPACRGGSRRSRCRVRPRPSIVGRSIASSASNRSGSVSSKPNTRSAPAMAVSASVYCRPMLAIGLKNCGIKSAKTTSDSNRSTCDAAA